MLKKSQNIEYGDDGYTKVRCRIHIFSQRIFGIDIGGMKVGHWFGVVHEGPNITIQIT